MDTITETYELHPEFVKRLGPAAAKIDDLESMEPAELVELLRAIGIARSSITTEIEAMERLRRKAVLTCTWYDPIEMPYKVARVSASSWANWRQEVTGVPSLVGKADYAVAQNDPKIRRDIYMLNAEMTLEPIADDIELAEAALLSWRGVGFAAARRAISLGVANSTKVAELLGVSGGLVRQNMKAKELRPPSKSPSELQRLRKERARKGILAYGAAGGVFVRDGRKRKVQRAPVSGVPSGGHGGARHWVRVDVHGMPVRERTSACGQVVVDVNHREDPRVTPRGLVAGEFDMRCQNTGCLEVWTMFDQLVDDLPPYRADVPVETGKSGKKRVRSKHYQKAAVPA